MHRAVAGVLAGIFASACLAQDDAVIVTATRFADSKRNLPVGVTVITADDLRQSATSNLPEILSQYGLLHIRDNSGSPNQQVDLRGFGITGDQNTLILVDGLRLSENEQVPAQLSSIPLDSIERIEVVRGSGAVLYGGGTSGGTINIITRRPEAGRAPRLLSWAAAGGWGTKEGRGGIAVQGETFGFSLDASYEDTDGYRQNNNLRQANVSGGLEARSRSGRAYLRFSGNDQELGTSWPAHRGADPGRSAAGARRPTTTASARAARSCWAAPGSRAATSWRPTCRAARGTPARSSARPFFSVTPSTTIRASKSPRSSRAPSWHSTRLDAATTSCSASIGSSGTSTAASPASPSRWVVLLRTGGRPTRRSTRRPTSGSPSARGSSSARAASGRRITSGGGCGRSTSAASRTTWRPTRPRCGRASAPAGRPTANTARASALGQLRRQRVLLSALRGDAPRAADRRSAASSAWNTSATACARARAYY